MVFPHKRIMSADGPDPVGPADWSRCRWDVLRQELGSVARLARELRLWTVLGCAHRLTPPHRPHNSLYVISDRGLVVTRYDERMLSMTKVSFMYTPGTSPVTFDVDGLRLGCALGMECHFPEVFAEYERLDADAVLFSTTGPGSVFALQAQAHAATNSYWVSYSASAQDDVAASGVIDPHGDWRAAVTPARRRWPSSTSNRRRATWPVRGVASPVPACTTPTGSTSIAVARTSAASSRRHLSGRLVQTG